MKYVFSHLLFKYHFHPYNCHYRNFILHTKFYKNRERSVVHQCGFAINVIFINILETKLIFIYLNYYYASQFSEQL